MFENVELLEVVLSILGVVVTGIVLPIGKALLDVLTTKYKNGYTEIFANGVKNVVESLQGEAETLKKYAEDGKLSKEEIAALQAKTLELVKNNVDDVTIKAIEKGNVDLDKYIQTMVDKTIEEIKKNALK